MATRSGDEIDLTEIISKVAELISEESPIIQGFEDQFESLEPGLRALQVILKGSEAQRSSNDREVNLLMGKLKDVAFSAKTHIDNFIKKREGQIERVKFKRYVSLLSNARTQKELIKLLKQVAVQISELITRARELNFTAVADSSFGLETWNGSSVVGRDESAQILEGYLLSKQRNRASTITILGVKGVGKTTLASMVYNNAMIASHFTCRAWVTVQQDSDPRDILHSIAKQVIQGYNNGDLVQSILLALSSRERYLIVLDDVSKPEVWRQLQEVLPITCAGAVIIVTQDRETALEASSRGLIHQVQLLTPEESWELFCAKLGDVPQELMHLGKAIVESCKGLPLTISETVGILSREARTVDRWNWLLQELQQKGSIKHIAADALPPNLKKCLYYFLLFDENYEIPVRRLIALWLAEGLVHPEGFNDEIPLEATANKYLIDLENRTVIQVLRKKTNGDIKACRLHHIIRDILLPKAQESHFFNGSSSNVIHVYRLAHLPEVEGATSSERAAERNQQRGNLPTSFKHMRSFLSFDPREGREPGEHIRDFLIKGIKMGGFKRLRVMDLEGVFRPILPDFVLKELSHLRYLGLRRTYSDILPASVGCLQKLQTLDLKHTSISTVPHSIWKLKELRHLYLSQDYRTRLPCPSSVTPISLTDLQTLWGGYIDDQSLIKDGLDRLKSLKKLSLTCQMEASKQKALEEWIVNVPCLESLKLRSINQVVQPSSLYFEHLSGLANLKSLYLFGKIESTHVSVLSTLPKRLSQITLSLSKLEQDPMPILGKLQELRILDLLSESYTGKTMMCPASSFQQLRFLKLWKLKELEDWTVDKEAMPVIGAIEIRSCLKLKTYPVKMKHLIYFQ
ncbi:probable disease resistance RPP8-like protein 2 [Chenopodium quinoa]|uniref:Uncharacterized protein n=1 Tax=Chenopodium quinoa TaxID=63459 RepID=A0A803MYK1_CHEQI|nr:probable disease resistance RPP8-like protein 2 [Chenopodium quinoa]